MLRWLKEIWTGSDPVEFESRFGLAESVERLKAATRRWTLFVVAQEVASGRVTASHVSLQRVIPMVGNSFKPFFVGRFLLSGGKVVLKGRFTLHWLVKIFMAFWLGFCLLFTALAVVAATRSTQAAPIPFAGFAMFLAGLGMMKLGGWFSRNDPAWLSTVIRKALGNQAEAAQISSTREMPSQQQNRWPPRVILAVSGVLLLLGLMALASAITGVQSYQGYPGGAVVTHYADMRMRYAVAAYGALMLALSIGIYQQRVFAWRIGFVVLFGGMAFQAFGLLTRDDLGASRTPAMIFCVFGAVISFVWGRWWYAQRAYFQK